MRYYAFSTYLKETYGEKVRRISLDAGFTCPNRDGSLSSGGCVFCNEDAFSGSVGRVLPLSQQLAGGIEAAMKKGYGKFIAYFQNGSGTYASLDILKKAYDIVLEEKDCVALYVSTRPDCVDEGVLELLASYSSKLDVWLELGVQTARDATLSRLNRGHDFEVSRRAILAAAEKGINVGCHLMLGLPGETREDMIRTAKELSALPVSGIKLHLCHVLKGTSLEKDYEKGQIELLGEAEYIDIVCDLLESVRKNIVIMRLVSDAQKDLLVAPQWMNEKLRLLNEIDKELRKRDTFQGSKADLPSA